MAPLLRGCHFDWLSAACHARLLTDAAMSSESELLVEVASLIQSRTTCSARAEALLAVSESLAEAHQAGAANLAPCASRLAQDIGFSSLCLGFAHSAHVSAARAYLRVLAQALPAAESAELRLAVLRAVVAGDDACVLLMPTVVSEVAQHDWPLCRATLDKCLAMVADETRSTIALEAVEALMTSCPPAELEPLLQGFRGTWWPRMQAGTEAATATRSWAAVTLALLQRGFAEQGTSFLHQLLELIEDPERAAQVPVAFRVLLPLKLGADTSPLPPAVLEELSATTLPKLLGQAKSGGGTGFSPQQRAAIQCCVALLSSLPGERAVADLKDDVRWFVLTGLGVLQEAAGDEASDVLRDPTFALQVLQLFLRAVEHSDMTGTATGAAPSPPGAWIRTDLNSLVIPLTAFAAAHSVPLVRVGCFQVVASLIEKHPAQMVALQKPLAACFRRGIEDRRKEVRRMASASLNSWCCVDALYRS